MSAVSSTRAFGLKDLEQFRARLNELRTALDLPAEATDFVAYTDGACIGNPSGPGGWAAAVFSADEQSTWYLWGHLSSTSNNRAEALGVLAALEWVPPASRLSIYSDSELTVRIFAGQYKARANPEIWELIRGARSDKRLEVSLEWVRGHAGDEGNELADRLSKLGALNGDTAGLAALDAEPARRVQQREAPQLVGLQPQGEWERDFIRSVAKQLRGGRALSNKQQAIVDRIRARGTAPPGA